MDSIQHIVEVLARLWIVMVVVLFFISSGRSNKDDRFSTLFLMATISSVLPVIQYSGEMAKTGLGTFLWGFPFVSYFGFFLTFLGLVIQWTGILTLRRQWSTVVAISDHPRLIETGIYKLIRHPIYAAVLLELLGFGVALANWISILLLVVPNAAGFAYRIFVEEKALERYFGDDYLRYERRTKRLIPGVF